MTEAADVTNSGSSHYYPHDVWRDMDSRLTPSNHRRPRLIVVDECKDGNFAFGELGEDGCVWDTTLIGEVLSPIETAIRKRSQVAGTVNVAGVIYAFTFNRCG